MIKINCHWYTAAEVKEALEKKGFTVITLEVSVDPRDFPSYETYALKSGEEPTVLNTMKSVALDQFNKKPPLI